MWECRKLKLLYCLWSRDQEWMQKGLHKRKNPLKQPICYILLTIQIMLALSKYLTIRPKVCLWILLGHFGLTGTLNVHSCWLELLLEVETVQSQSESENYYNYNLRLSITISITLFVLVFKLVKFFLKLLFCHFYHG